MPLQQGPEAGGPALERQEDSWVDTQAQKQQGNHRQGWGRQLQGRKEAAGRSGWDRAKRMDGDGAKSQRWRWDGDRGMEGEGLG